MATRADGVMKYFREHKTWMEDRINSGIETNRKGYMKLSFVDSEGKPVENVQVRLEQKTHDFRFGCNLFLLDELETPEKNQIFKERFAELFNLGTLPFYWSDLEPEQGKPRFAKDSPKVYRRPAPDLCLEYCDAYGIEPKLHCLNYDQWSPVWLPRDVRQVKELLEKRIAQIAERYAHKIPSMEVINETMCNEYDKPFRRSTPFFREPDIVEWSFEHARKHLPANHLIINEATPHVWGNRFKYDRSAYYMQIQRALMKGASIDSIGMQYHQFHSREDEPEQAKFLCDPVRLYQVMDQYADFRKPIQITEVTVPAYSWEEEDEQVQAELIETLYRIWFSHPNMEAIVYWNMADGYAAFATPGDMTNGENRYHGGLLRFDMTPKPAFRVLKRLIHETWHTDLQANTGASAQLEAKGFYGTYAVQATAGGNTVIRQIHLKKGIDNKFTIQIG